MIEAGLEKSGISLPESEIDRLLATFLSYYEANLSASSRPFEDAIPVLERLRGQGHKLAVCTNKRIGFSVQLLDALGMSPLFEAIAGRTPSPSTNPTRASLWCDPDGGRRHEPRHNDWGYTRGR